MTVDEFFKALRQVTGGQQWKRREDGSVRRWRVVASRTATPVTVPRSIEDCPISAVHAVLCTKNHGTPGSAFPRQTGECLGLNSEEISAIQYAADGYLGDVTRKRYRRRLLRILKPQAARKGSEQ